MNPLLLAFAASGVAFLAGMAFGKLEQCQWRRQPRAAGPFDLDWQPATACDITGADLGLASFECPRWTESAGMCCPPGVVKRDCPGLNRLR